MRDIKFRFWDKDTKVMIQADFSDLCGGMYYIENENTMQYTGLKDKNGKEIYEGDIVKYHFKYLSKDKDDKMNKERISKVFWCEFRGSWSVYASKIGNVITSLMVSLLYSIFNNSWFSNMFPITSTVLPF